MGFDLEDFLASCQEDLMFRNDELRITAIGMHEPNAYEILLQDERAEFLLLISWDEDERILQICRTFHVSRAAFDVFRSGTELPHRKGKGFKSQLWCVDADKGDTLAGMTVIFTAVAVNVPEDDLKTEFRANLETLLKETRADADAVALPGGGQVSESPRVLH